MNTYLNNLQTVMPIGIERESTLEKEKIRKNGDQVLSEKFIPVPQARTGEGDLVIWRVHFEALRATSPRDIYLDINGDIIFGVESATTDVINLSHYNDHVIGVSRRHLKITPTKTDLWITDLDSTNGTRINGRFVEPNQPYTIYNGDVLEMGNLIFVVNVLKAPVDRFILTGDSSGIVNALTHISTVITSNLDPDQVLDRILETAVNLCEADEIALLLCDEQTGELYLRAERGVGDRKTRLMKVPVKQESVLSEVLRTGRPLRNKKTNGQKSKIVTGYLVEAALYVPILMGERSLGILIAMHRHKEKEFCPEDEHLLSTIAKFSAIAIQNAQKYEAANLALKTRVEELSSYTEILQTLARANSISSIYSILREKIRERWNVDNIGLWFVEPATKKLVPFPRPTFHKSYLFGEDLIGDVASTGEPILATDIKLFSEPANSPEPTLQLLARSAVCVPLVENNAVVGVLAAFSKQENVFADEDIKVLQRFSVAAASALRNVWLYEQMDKQRATMLAAINMLPHPLMIVDRDDKITVSNKAAEALLEEVHSLNNPRQDSAGSRLLPLISLMHGLSESQWRTQEIVIGDKAYAATLQYASMVGTIILMQDVTDPVTGSFNHQHFRKVAEQAFQQAKRYAKPLAALVVGLDGIEQLMDTHGYSTGNHILKGLASQLRSSLRTPDILGRYKENKFIIIMPETTLDNARVVAERIRKLSKKSGLVKNYKISSEFVIGAAVLECGNDSSIDMLIERACRDYMSSNNGKARPRNVLEEG